MYGEFRGPFPRRTTERTRIYYRAPVRPGSTIDTALGELWPRADKRWNWVRFKTEWYRGWSAGQGVANSETEAREAIEQGWAPDAQPVIGEKV